MLSCNADGYGGTGARYRRRQNPSISIGTVSFTGENASFSLNFSGSRDVYNGVTINNGDTDDTIITRITNDPVLGVFHIEQTLNGETVNVQNKTYDPTIFNQTTDIPLILGGAYGSNPPVADNYLSTSLISGQLNYFKFKFTT